MGTRPKFWLPAAEILLGAIALAILTSVGLRLDLNLGTASLAYLIVVVLLSLRGSVIPVVPLSVVAAACLDYFFTEPRFSLQIDAPKDAVAVAAFLTSPVVIAGHCHRILRSNDL